MEAHGCSRFSEKSPSNVLVLETLARIAPEAKLIFVLRDPRAVVASMKEVRARYQRDGTPVPLIVGSPFASIETARSHIEAGLRAMDDLGDRVLRVRYEALVQHPEAETRRWCEFLGLDWVSTMLDPNAFEKSTRRRKGLDGKWYDEAGFHRPVESSDLDKWRGNLTAFEHAAIAAHFSETARHDEFPYDLQEGRAFPFLERLARGAYKGGEAATAARRMLRRGLKRAIGAR
jgi:hypothetical protein